MYDSVVCDTLATASGHRLGCLRLNVEQTLNALTLDMVERISEQLRRWQDDPAVVAVVIHGSGERAFCAGGDVQALYRSAVDQPGGPCHYAETFFAREYRLNHQLYHYPKPLLCWGHGIVMGGGLGIMAGCSHRVVTEQTRIAMPEVTIALFPDVGGSYFLNRMPGQCGRFLALTAAAINATDSLYAGLADHCLPQASFEAVLAAMTAQHWSGTPGDGDQLTAVLQAQQRSTPSSLPEAQLQPQQAMIDCVCEGDELSVIVERLLALDSDDPWVQRAQAGAAGGSPLAMRWIFQQLQRCRRASLAAVFQSELVLATNIVRHPEFAEGVRALLIDKDRNPQWQYPTVAAVDEATLAAFFQSPWPDNPLADLEAA